MGNYINKSILIDSESGEVLRENSWLGYDGFSEKGYKYRNRAICIKYYFDSLPENYDKETLMLLFLIAELMNEENVLVYRVKRKSKFSKILYKPMDKDEIREKIRFKFGENKFDRCWKVLNKKALKRIKYNDVYVWAVNPSIISKCRDVPFWLYEAFQDSMNPHLSAVAIKKLQNKLNSFYDEEGNSV